MFSLRSNPFNFRYVSSTRLVQICLDDSNCIRRLSTGFWRASRKTFVKLLVKTFSVTTVLSSDLLIKSSELSKKSQLNSLETTFAISRFLSKTPDSWYLLDSESCFIWNLPRLQHPITTTCKINFVFYKYKLLLSISLNFALICCYVGFF